MGCGKNDILEFRLTAISIKIGHEMTYIFKNET
jgi:hypothetical protein